MHEIEPYYQWRDYYISSEDKLSPFYKKVYSEFEFSNRIYNYLIHPQWDNFGSSTLFCKVLYADYEQTFAVIEFIGEWNDTLHNDVMELRKGLIDALLDAGITKFLLIGENVLNFHASDNLYYAEWHEEILEKDGWIVAMNFRDHVVIEMQGADIDQFVFMGSAYNDFQWRKLKPQNMMEAVEELIVRRID